MIFDFKVLPEKLKHLENGTEITSMYELTIFRESLIAEYEKDPIAVCNTMRQVMYMYYYPFGITWVNGDEAFETMYEMFCRRKEASSITVEIIQVECIDENVYGRNNKSVTCGFRLNLGDTTEYSSIIQN